MNIKKSYYTPSVVEAVLLSAISIFLLSFGIIKFEAAPHIPILVVIIFLLFYGLLRKIPFKVMEEGLINGAMAGIGAVILLLFIGLLIGSWMISGTIPTLVSTGFSLATSHYFYAIVFVITALVGVSIGSSLTTVATIGVAFISIAQTIDLSMAITAGAIVSGAFFGDKMSPLSDTTNLASTIVKVDLFEHIRNMGWTTVPAFLLSLLFFIFVSPSVEEADLSNIDHFQDLLYSTGLIHWYSWLPLVLLIVLSIKNVPAILSLAASSLLAVVLSFINQMLPIGDLLNVLFNGYMSETGNTALDELLTRGGVSSMFFTVSLVLLALAMGGLLFTLGIVPRLIESIAGLLNNVGSVITASAMTAIGLNVMIGEQYLAILLTGESFQSQFAKVGLANKNLSRVLEDAGTVVNPLVPWSVCGVFITSMLEVPVLSYIPFAIFCWLCPILSILFGISGKTLTYLK